MRLTILAVGRLKRGPERQLAERYQERAAQAGRPLGFRGLDVIEIDESRSREVERRRMEESVALLTVLPEQAALVALDETGESLSSPQFASRLARWRDGGQPDLAFAIGGPDGLAPAVRDRAALRLAFGALTWPHQIARIMLMEQVYRAMTILAGHPYHRS